jgi:hypothetical protein
MKYLFGKQGVVFRFLTQKWMDNGTLMVIHRCNVEEQNGEDVANGRKGVPVEPGVGETRMQNQKVYATMRRSGSERDGGYDLRKVN